MAEGKRRFGNNSENWKFVCPACGRVNSEREFRELGVDTEFAYSTCIGRHNGKGVKGYGIKKGQEPPKSGCDWAAFGLLRTMCKGNVVICGDTRVDVFAFADPDLQTTSGEA
jgi:hypothetical protein